MPGIRRDGDRGVKRTLAQPTAPVRTISLRELADKLDRGDPFRLVMALNRWAFNAKHIPGSEHYDNEDDLKSAIDPTEEMVVYCSNEACHSSVALYHALVKAGYENVRRFSGGLQEWEENGMPLEGEWARRSR
jgi:rhodanese-related sulfurtransferase